MSPIGFRILVKKRNTRIITDITKTSIPYNLATRICTNVSEKNTREIRLNKLKIYILKQKYPEQLIHNGIYKTKKLELSELFLTRGRERNSNVIPFVNTHNPRNQNVNCIINQLNTILKKGQATRGIFENVRIISF